MGGTHMSAELFSWFALNILHLVHLIKENKMGVVNFVRANLIDLVHREPSSFRETTFLPFNLSLAPLFFHLLV
jgi:hypothetical protein